MLVKAYFVEGGPFSRMPEALMTGVQIVTTKPI